jgi:hypothetical protein
MNADSALAELEALATKLGIELSYDAMTGEGAGVGGLCKVRGQWRLIVERRASATEKVSMLARCLARFDLENEYLSPAVRRLIDQNRPAA